MKNTTPIGQAPKRPAARKRQSRKTSRNSFQHRQPRSKKKKAPEYQPKSEQKSKPQNTGDTRAVNIDVSGKGSTWKASLLLVDDGSIVASHCPHCCYLDMRCGEICGNKVMIQVSRYKCNRWMDMQLDHSDKRDNSKQCPECQKHLMLSLGDYDRPIKRRKTAGNAYVAVLYVDEGH